MSLQFKNVDLGLIESSFKETAAHGEAFIARFYDLFLSSNPEVAALFRHGDLRQQRRKLLLALVMIIENIRDPSMSRYLIDLGQVHIQQYGVSPEFVPLFRDALLSTFEEFLGEGWTAEHQKAWENTLTTISSYMFNTI